VNGSGVTDIDGNNYKTIIIGDKEWMAENLKVTRFLNGEPIYLASSTADWNNLDLNRSPGYSAPGYSIQNISPYGNMYNWYAVSNLKGVCPLGWRVPSASVWDSLINILGGQFLAGGKMKVVGFDYWLSPNLSATNESGFSAVGSGYNDPLGAFYAFKNNCFFWSNTEFSQNDAIYFWLYSDRAMIDKLNKPKNNGFNIRCVK
jgi:uncharacterized protein (TIGR02145 family)